MTDASRPAGVPPGATWRPAMTALDYTSMRACVIASFRGLYGHDPTESPGSGVDDVGYWVGVSDHWGEFSDHIFRAGWSLYWERKLAGSDTVSPVFGDQPAQFQPGAPSPTPPPTPTPSPVDLRAVLTRLNDLDTRMAMLIGSVQALGSTVAALSARVMALEGRPWPKYKTNWITLTPDPPQ